MTEQGVSLACFSFRSRGLTTDPANRGISFHELRGISASQVVSNPKDPRNPNPRPHCQGNHCMSSHSAVAGRSVKVRLVTLALAHPGDVTKLPLLSDPRIRQRGPAP